MNRWHSSGQALLITLLVLAVALTAGLSLVTRTITDISISEKESASSKAFEAAEAGVEEALRAIEVGGSVPGSLSLAPGGEAANVRIEVSEPTGELANRKIYSGEAATFWLNSFLLDGSLFPSYKDEITGQTKTLSYDKNNIKICWSGSANNIEAAIYYQSGGDKVKREYLSGGGGCAGLDKGVTVNNLPNGTKFINVRFYGGIDDPEDTITVAMEGVGAALPRQGNIIDTEATVSKVARRLIYFQGWPVPPLFFDFALFSGGNLSK